MTIAGCSVASADPYVGVMRGWRLAWLLVGGSIFGCGGGEVLGDDAASGAGNTSAGTGTIPSAGTGSGATPGTGGGSSGTGPSAGAGGTGTVVPLPTGVDAAALIPARIRRLNNAEYDATVQALLGTALAPGRTFAPDARQAGYTLNDAQRVDAVTARQIFASAGELALDVKTNHLATMAPCDNPEAGGEACATSFIASFGARAYRRPLTAEEASGLLTVYQAGALDATYADGIEQVMRAALQSAGLLYLTEIGDGGVAADGTLSLTPYELASSLSYVVTGGPPDAELVDSALSGVLFTPDGRYDQVWRLIQATAGGRPVARDRMVRVVGEWFGVDRIEQTDKDANIYPQYRPLKQQIEQESRDFVTAVLMNTGTVSELLSSDISVAGSELASFYQGEGAPARRGILNRLAFLATYGHATESAPVLRGVAVARRVACIPVPPPSDSGLIVTTPPPDSTFTTRERFAQHVSDPTCSNCHVLIDPFGFTFEHFDGMGRYRAQDNNKPVNSATTIALSMPGLDGDYADSNALALALASSAEVRECMARQMFRASAGRSDPTVIATEAAFVEIWKRLPEAEQGNILTTLVEFVKSPIFTHRRAQ